jgi:nucleoside-diphosphate-sugar epimerase
MTKVLVTGAGGFIGHHLVTHLKKQGYWVRGADLKAPEYSPIDADAPGRTVSRQPKASTKCMRWRPTWEGWDSSRVITRRSCITMR